MFSPLDKNHVVTLNYNNMHFRISEYNNNNNIINYNIIMCISVVAQVVLRLARPLIMWYQGHVPVSRCSRIL